MRNSTCMHIHACAHARTHTHTHTEVAIILSSQVTASCDVGCADEYSDDDDDWHPSANSCLTSVTRLTYRIMSYTSAGHEGTAATRSLVQSEEGSLIISNMV